MVGLMMEIKNLKERNKNLSDEERRKNAEEMISKYFRVLKDYKYLINIIY